MTKDAGAPTPQLAFWQGAFGDAYAERNALTAERRAARAAMWTTILGRLPAPPASILEVGANVGLNIAALQGVTPATLYALEPNAAAREALGRLLARERVLDGAADAIPLADGAVDLVFTCGVLIHVAPEHRLAACREMHRVAKRHLVTIEYFSDRDETVRYRGHEGQLYKGDFGSVWLDNFADVRVVDYGFFWKRATGLDNLTWWLLAKG